MHKIIGEKCYLVPFEEKHLNDENYLVWLRDYDVMKTINRVDYLRPVSFAEVKQYCENVMQSQSDMFMAIHAKYDNKFIGTLRVNQVNWHTKVADIGILIGDKDYWGKGIATDSIRIMCNYLFKKLGFRRLTAGLMSINPAMLKVFEKLGFRKEGVFRKHDAFEGEYVDHIYLGCLKDEFKL